MSCVLEALNIGSNLCASSAAPHHKRMSIAAGDMVCEYTLGCTKAVCDRSYVQPHGCVARGWKHSRLRMLAVGTGVVSLLAKSRHHLFPREPCTSTDRCGTLRTVLEFQNGMGLSTPGSQAEGVMVSPCRCIYWISSPVSSQPQVTFKPTSPICLCSVILPCVTYSYRIKGS